MNPRLVLDASAFDLLGTGDEDLRALLRRINQQRGEVCCAAVTLAEVCRGVRRTQQVESALVRDLGGMRIRVLPTDKKLAKRVGSILHDTSSGSERIADAHVVAVCADPDIDVALVLTSDADDIVELSSAVSTRIMIRDPSRLSELAT